MQHAFQPVKQTAKPRSPVAGAVKTADSLWMKAGPCLALLNATSFLISAAGPLGRSPGNVSCAMSSASRPQVSTRTPLPPGNTVWAPVGCQGPEMQSRLEGLEAVMWQGVLPSTTLRFALGPPMKPVPVP